MEHPQIQRDLEELKRMQRWLEKARAVTRKTEQRLRQVLGPAGDLCSKCDPSETPPRKGDSHG